jgi:hypothetical protein
MLPYEFQRIIIAGSIAESFGPDEDLQAVYE